jgi:hypothetical protein
MYGWLVRRQVLAPWERLSDHELEAMRLPLVWPLMSHLTAVRLRYRSCA